jgi:SAM-dependent methyltransferase
MDRRPTRQSAPHRVGDVDFARLYDDHAEYAARRLDGSFEQERIQLEVIEFKLPNFFRLLPPDWLPSRLLEIGCATGELIATFPAQPGGQRVGVDISAANVAAAASRFPHVRFINGDFRSLDDQDFDVVILSDVLEHVEDDASFLADAARSGKMVLVNLPLEDNWLNVGRAYGPNDVSGHLRKYNIQQGMDLFTRAGLRVLSQHRVWIHETDVELKRRELRRRHFGSAFAGSRLVRLAKEGVMGTGRLIPALGRRLFESNLFVSATCQTSR